MEGLLLIPIILTAWLVSYLIEIIIKSLYIFIKNIISNINIILLEIRISNKN